MFTVEIKSDTVTAALTELGAAMENMQPVFDAIGEYLVVSTKDRFKEGVSPAGAKWAPKSPATLAAYGARKSNRIDIRPLFGPSGMLSSQIHHEAGRDQVEIGSNLIYAAVQQFGAAKGSLGAYSGTDKNGRAYSGVAPWGDIPARPFLGISAQDETALLDILTEWARDHTGD